MGGTGKTPMVLHLATALAAQGLRACVAMRGYAPSASGVHGSNTGTRDAAAPGQGRAGPPHTPAPGDRSDEAAAYGRAFARLNLDVPIVAQPDRAAGVRALLAAGERIDAVLLDDGFQHHRLARDLDIVLIDATRPPFRDRLVPAGWLREPTSALKRAGAVVVTHAEAVAMDELARLEGQLERVWGKPPVAIASHAWVGLDIDDGAEPATQRPPEAQGGLLPVGWLGGKRVLSVCAIGNPAPFLSAAARAIGAEPASTIVLRDHDPYADSTLRRIAASARGMDAVLTTDKDYSKLAGRLAGVGCPIVRPRLDLRFDRGGAELVTMVRMAARAGAPADE
jgi:tetraacyldisaccharide 4'-kinase